MCLSKWLISQTVIEATKACHMSCSLLVMNHVTVTVIRSAVEMLVRDVPLQLWKGMKVERVAVELPLSGVLT